ncbi:putative kinetochore protein NDC80 [Mycena sanguinolenta]|uniref:Kinetochore protein NDC80 n=1 Tax=Mycena sanguinolenta TaxID=230812 RepID=A0A8H6YFW9_9AGAR|nr:putative kinetochore protein NDC80 [Mycena sanguinolenta]
MSILDPNLLSQNARFEEQFVPALKAFDYPFAHSIDSRWLATPASMYSWPPLLGVLHWLVQMSKVTFPVFSGDSTLQKPLNVSEDFDDPCDHGALAFAYCAEAYGLWMNMDDNFTAPTKILEDRYDQNEELSQKAIDDATSQVEQSEAELNKLKLTASSIVKLQQEYDLMNSDTEKFQKILDRYNSRIKKLQDKIARGEAQTVTLDEQIAQLKAELELSSTVKAQNLSLEQVIKMNADHERLSQEDLEQKIAETNRVVLALGIRSADRLGDAEDTVDAYMDLFSSLGLSPLSLLRCKTWILPFAFRPTSRTCCREQIPGEAKRSARASVESERIRLENELDQLTLERENIDEEIAEMKKKVVALNEQADALRDVARQEALVAGAETERLERDLAHAKTTALATRMEVKSRLRALQIDYQEQVERVSRLKEATLREIVKSTNKIAMFKAEVSQHLTDLRVFAEESENSTG